MGLLDSLFGGMEGSSKLTPQESFAGILMGASGCDGHIAEEEVDGLITCLVRMKLFQRYDGRQYGKTLNKLHGFMKKKGVDALIDSCTETLPKELAKAAFTNACDIVLADGVVEPDEKAFIDRLREKLQIDSKTAKTIAEVMVIKNKGQRSHIAQAKFQPSADWELFMSLFDDVLDDSSFAPEQFGPQEGFAGTLLAASACDGHIADEEVGSLVSTLTRMKMYQHVPPHKFNSMMDRLMGVLKRGGPEKLIAAAVPAIPPELRETVFANACDIVLADGVVEADEKEFIDDLMIKLEMDKNRAKTIVQVMVFKNQG